MLIGIPEILLAMALVLLPIACLTNWAAAFKQLQLGEPLVPTAYRDNVSWGLMDLGVIVAIVGVIAGLGVQVVAQNMGIEDTSLTKMMRPEDQGRFFLIFGTGTLLATLLSFGWIRLRYGRIDGFSARHFGSDVELGGRWFVMLVVPVLLMQLALTYWFPSKHPLIEMLRLTKNMSLLPIAAFAAMIAAPIFEEAFFRLFLQGWLEKLQLTAARMKAGIGTKADTDAVLLGGESSASLLVEPDANPFRSPPGNGSTPHVTDTPSKSVPVDDNPYSAPEEAGDVLEEDEESEERPILWVPILVSSGLFALAHVQHGPDWVPLFFLALGLGYIYQRTHRIVPCIVVHVLMNGLGILQLWSAVRQ